MTDNRHLISTAYEPSELIGLEPGLNLIGGFPMEHKLACRGWFWVTSTADRYGHLISVCNGRVIKCLLCPVLPTWDVHGAAAFYRARSGTTMFTRLWETSAWSPILNFGAGAKDHVGLTDQYIATRGVGFTRKLAPSTTRERYAKTAARSSRLNTVGRSSGTRCCQGQSNSFYGWNDISAPERTHVIGYGFLRRSAWRQGINDARLVTHSTSRFIR